MNEKIIFFFEIQVGPSVGSTPPMRRVDSSTNNGAGQTFITSAIMTTFIAFSIKLDNFDHLLWCDQYYL